MTPQPSAPRTLIRGGSIVAFDGEGHRMLEDGVLVFAGDRIVHVGPSFAGEVDVVIDAAGMLVMPGLISTHCHLRLNEGYRMVIDGGRRDFMRSGFLNYAGPKAGSSRGFVQDQDLDAAVSFALMSLLRFGVTTAVELDNGGHDRGETVARLAGECGIRLYYSPYVTAAQYRFRPDGILDQVWDEAAGFAGLAQAADFIDRHQGGSDGRVQGIVVLNEFFAATPALRREALALARAKGVRLTTHFSEQLYEFHEILRTFGGTPVEVAAREGFLGPDVILGHCLYVGGHSMTSYPHPDDLRILAESGATVSHSPVAYSRRGIAFESLQRFLDAGIGLSLGTDSMPLDLIREMNCAAVTCKIVERNHEAGRAADVFTAATLGGARALGRDDLGRLAPGAKADIVLVDMDNLAVGPILDPIRMLVHCGAGDMVDTVIVDGVTRVRGKRPLFWDETSVRRAARASAARIWSSFQAYDWAGRELEEVYPPSFRRWS